MPSAARKPSRRKPKQARSRETLLVILQGAAQVFEARGYAKGTTNHVAARAGVSVGTLYQYFENKDAILTALMEQHLNEGAALVTERLGRIMAVAPTGQLDLDATLGELVEAVIALHENTPRLHRVLFEEVPWPREMRDRLSAMEQGLSAQVALLLQATPGLSVTHPERAAWMVVQLVELLTHRYVLDPPDDIPPEAFRHELVSLLRGYLGDRSDS